MSIENTLCAENLFKAAPDMSCKPDLEQAKLDTKRMVSGSFFIKNTLVDSSYESVDENGLFSVYQSIKNEKLRAFFALNNHQNGLYQFLTDIKAAITVAIMSNDQLKDTEKSDIFLSTFEAGVDNLKIEINSIEGSETKYRYTATTKTSGTQKDFFAVSCSVEIDETNQKIIVKNKRITLSQEAAGYLGITELEYNYQDETFYSSGAEISNFEVLWEKKKKAILANLAAYKSAEKRNDYVGEIGKLENNVKYYMTEMGRSLRKTAEDTQEKDVENSIAGIKKNNDEFMYKIKLKLKQLYSSKEKKQKIDKEFDQHLSQLQFNSRQPFIDKAIDNIGNGNILSADPKVNVGKGKDEIELGKVLKVQLQEKSNTFFENIELTSSHSIKNQFEAFSNDFDKTIENSGLDIPKNTWKPIFDYVSHSLNEIGFTSAASVVDSISHFIFGCTKYEIAKKGCQIVKTLSEELKELPAISPAVM